MHDGHVAYSWDENERVDGDVGRDVDEVVHQSAGEPTELPSLRTVLVRCERRDDDDEAEVSEGEVQQQ